MSETSHPLTRDPEETEGQKNQQEDLQGEEIQDRETAGTVTKDQNHRSEEGSSAGDQTPRYGPDSPGVSPTPHSESDDWGADKDQKDLAKEKEKSNQQKGRHSESSSPEQSQDKQEKWSLRSVGDFFTRRSGSRIKNVFSGGKECKENTENQTQSSGSTEPPGVVPPQKGQKSEPLKGRFYDIDGDASWLIDQLKDEAIPGYDFITSHSLEKVKFEECSLVILCLSHKSGCEGNVKEFLERCRKPVIGVITGLENISSEEEKREYWENVSKDFKLSKFDLITLTKQDEQIIKTKNSETRMRLDTKIKDMKHILQNSAEKNHGQSLQKRSKPKVEIGIFSRSDESDYSWLVALLRSAEFSDWVRDVTPCYISNSGRQKFREDVSKCKVGILYHTKNKGRINVTDVTDALYNEELRHLTERLGKDNVIVVIDDLEDGSDIEKKRILESQRSIENCARGLFLFTLDEKRIASAETKMTQLRAMIRF